MVRWHNWKYFTYSGFEGEDRLFDLAADPEERRNVIADHPDVVKAMQGALVGLKSYDQVMEHEHWLTSQLRLLLQCNYDDPEEHWPFPKDMEVLENPIQRKTPFKPTAWAPLMRKRIMNSKMKP